MLLMLVWYLRRGLVSPSYCFLPCSAWKHPVCQRMPPSITDMHMHAQCGGFLFWVSIIHRTKAIIHLEGLRWTLCDSAYSNNSSPAILTTHPSWISIPDAHLHWDISRQDWILARCPFHCDGPENEMVEHERLWGHRGSKWRWFLTHLNTSTFFFFFFSFYHLSCSWYPFSLLDKYLTPVRGEIFISIKI